MSAREGKYPSVETNLNTETIGERNIVYNYCNKKIVIGNVFFTIICNKKIVIENI